jgi:D-alanine-D-alanine ligase
MKIVVLHSAVSAEANPDELDTLVQVEAVTAALGRLGHQAVELPCTLNLELLQQALLELRPQLIFNLVESIEGTGRLLHLAAALLSHLRIPYTGSSTTALFLTTHKLASKQLMHLSGLPVPAWVTAEELRAGKRLPPGKLIIKSVWEHASVGLNDESIIEPASVEELLRELERRRPMLGGQCFAEAFISGREFNLSVLERDHDFAVLPPAEMLFCDYPADKPKLVGYKAKWEENSFECHHTRRTFVAAPQDQNLFRRLSQLALESCRPFQVRGYARVDFRVSNEGQPFILEVNTNPCIAPDAGFIAAAKQAQLEYDPIIGLIIEAALRPR